MAQMLLIAATTALLTAALTAALTWLLAWWLYRQRLRDQLQRQLLEAQEEFERRVQAGVKAAGEELLPAFREQVALGFKDAIRESAPMDLVEDSAKIVSRSAKLLEDGVKSLFGVKSPKR